MMRRQYIATRGKAIMSQDQNKARIDATRARIPDTAVPDYLREMLIGMTGLARTSGHTLLAYLLEVAAQEAAQQSKNQH